MNLPISGITFNDNVLYGSVVKYKNGQKIVTRSIIEEYETKILDELINDDFHYARHHIENYLKEERITYERLRDLLEIFYREDPEEARQRHYPIRLFQICPINEYHRRIDHLLTELDSSVKSLKLFDKNLEMGSQEKRLNDPDEEKKRNEMGLTIGMYALRKAILTDFGTPENIPHPRKKIKEQYGSTFDSRYHQYVNHRWRGAKGKSFEDVFLHLPSQVVVFVKQMARAFIQKN